MLRVTLGEVLNLQTVDSPRVSQHIIGRFPKQTPGTCVPATFLPFPRKLHLEAGRQGPLTLLLEASVSAH